MDENGAAIDQWIFVLANLVAFWNIWIKVILAVPLGVVGNRTADRMADQENVTDSFFVQDRQSTGMTHTDWTDIDIWPLFVRIIGARTEHF